MVSLCSLGAGYRAAALTRTFVACKLKTNSYVAYPNGALRLGGVW